MNPADAAVVVVGAGPVGLLAACELARRGVAVRVIDKLTAPTTESRAIAVHARSLEMFDSMGLLEELVASGVKATQMEMYAAGRRLARVEFGHVDSAFPFTVVTAQTETERILPGAWRHSGSPWSAAWSSPALPRTPGQPRRSDPAPADLQRVTDERAGGIQITKSHWLTEFEIHHAQVPAYRFGRVFLAGDAAHVHSPAGGQGMNTGLRDAFNLGWKLALAAQGRAGEQLLNSYQAERHPIGAKVIEFTTRLTWLGTLGGGVRTALRNQVLHAALGIGPLRDVMASQTEEVTIAYRNSPIVAGGPAHGGAVAAGDHAPFAADSSVRRQIGAARAISYSASRPAASRPPPPAMTAARSSSSSLQSRPPCPAMTP